MFLKFGLRQMFLINIQTPIVLKHNSKYQKKKKKLIKKLQKKRKIQQDIAELTNKNQQVINKRKKNV